MPGKRSFPGRLTLEQWLETPGDTRWKLIRRAQADLLGSFRHCADKRCRRGRACCSDDPLECVRRLRHWRGRKPEPKTIWRAWARLCELKVL
jgi:hypothetical protein